MRVHIIIEQLETTYRIWYVYFNLRKAVEKLTELREQYPEAAFFIDANRKVVE